MINEIRQYFKEQINPEGTAMRALIYGSDSAQMVIATGAYSSYATSETLTIGGYRNPDFDRTYIRDVITQGWHFITFNWNSCLLLYWWDLLITN